MAAAAAPAVVTGAALRRGLARALERLGESRDLINNLNVFPVPDGDTGTNMQLTLGAALAELGKLPARASVASVARAAAHGSLMGARGNSGVILSQVFRGLDSACHGHRELAPAELAEALQEGAQAAQRAVKRPVEGTLLSVAAAAAAAAIRSAEGEGDPGAVLGAAAEAAWKAVERSREQMDVLREAGVVDAGGFGLAVILAACAEELGGGVWAPPEGLGKPLRGEAADSSSEAASGPLDSLVPEDGFGYCTEFALVGSSLDPAEVRARLGSESEEDSSLVVGEPGLLHVHIHTREPWLLLDRAVELGQITRLKVEDMTEQHQQALRRVGAGNGPPPKRGRTAAGVVVVAAGSGFRELLLELGATAVVEGGPGTNPPTEELLRGVEEADADAVVLLPNHPNLLLGAEQAARMSRRPVAVVPSRNLAQGVAALLAFDPAADLEVNRKRMERALEGVHAVEVTKAARETQMAGREIAEGDVIALLDGDLVAAGGDLVQVVLEALGKLPEDSLEVVTVYQGEGSDDAQAELLEQAIRERLPALEIERHLGGQPLYPYIISAE